MYFDRGDELVEQIFSPNPFEHGDELAKRIFQPNPKESRMFSHRRVRRLRRRNPYRYNPDRGNCPHCDAGLRAKHYSSNQCWRCKRQLTRGRSHSLFGRAPGAALGIAARRRRLRRRYNPTGTSFFEHDAGVFGGPSWGRRRLRRYNPLWDKVKTAGKAAGGLAARAGKATARGVGRAARATKKWYDEGGRDKIIATSRAAGRTAGRAAAAAGRGLQRAGELAAEKLSEPAPAAGRYLRRYRYNPACEDCGCDMCSCGTSSRYRYNPCGCVDCDCDPCTCGSHRYRYNPCDDCDSDPCTCGSHSTYHPNPGTTRHWDPVEAGTARWEPGQMWAEAEPVEEDDLDRSYRYYRRNG